MSTASGYAKGIAHWTTRIDSPERECCHLTEFTNVVRCVFLGSSFGIPPSCSCHACWSAAALCGGSPLAVRGSPSWLVSLFAEGTPLYTPLFELLRHIGVVVSYRRASLPRGSTLGDNHGRFPSIYPWIYPWSSPWLPLVFFVLLPGTWFLKVSRYRVLGIACLRAMQSSDCYPQAHFLWTGSSTEGRFMASLVGELAGEFP